MRFQIDASSLALGANRIHAPRAPANHRLSWKHLFKTRLRKIHNCVIHNCVANDISWRKYMVYIVFFFKVLQEVPGSYKLSWWNFWIKGLATIDIESFMVNGNSLQITWVRPHHRKCYPEVVLRPWRKCYAYIELWSLEINHKSWSILSGYVVLILWDSKL